MSNVSFSTSVILGNAYLSLFFVANGDYNLLKKSTSAYSQAVSDVYTLPGDWESRRVWDIGGLKVSEVWECHSIQLGFTGLLLNTCVYIVCVHMQCNVLSLISLGRRKMWLLLTTQTCTSIKLQWVCEKLYGWADRFTLLLCVIECCLHLVLRLSVECLSTFSADTVTVSTVLCWMLYI